MSEGRYRYLASLLAKREAGNGSAESTTGDVPGAIPDNIDAILDRADGLIRDHPPPPASLEAGQCGGGSGGGRPPDISAAADDPGERSSRDRNNARATLLHHAGAALAKIGKGGKPLSPDERCAMEAIVIADGTRPSFLLDQARVSPDDPWVRDWSGAVGAAEDAIRPLARAVGRIQPRHGNASRFVGTGTLVDAAKGFVLTNYHVIYEAEHGFGVRMRHEADRIVVEGELEIDFLGEASSLEKCRFRICEVFLPPGYGAVFAGIDAAVCRIEEIDQKYVLPAAAKVLSAAPRYAQGSMSSLATIGFPGPPAMDSSGEVDWTFVVGELFGNASVSSGWRRAGSPMAWASLPKILPSWP